MIGKRKRLLSYIKDKNVLRYQELVKKIGIRGWFQLMKRKQSKKKKSNKKKKIYSDIDAFENLYKGEISKSGVPILPSKRARKTPEKIQVSKEDLAELSPSAQPDVNLEASSEAEESDDVSLDQVSEAEEQVSDNLSDENNS